MNPSLNRRNFLKAAGVFAAAEMLPGCAGITLATANQAPMELNRIEGYQPQVASFWVQRGKHADYLLSSV